MNLQKKSIIAKSAIIGDKVLLGRKTEIGDYTVLKGSINIGQSCFIGSNCVIGGDPKIKNHSRELGKIIIGNFSYIAENVCIDSSHEKSTVIGDNVYIMPHTYIGHDAKLSGNTIITAGCKLGGHVRIGESANLGLGVLIHQYCTIGPYSMIGMGSVVTKDIPPFSLAMGVPCRVTGINKIGLLRAKFTEEEIELIIKLFEEKADIKIKGRTRVSRNFEWYKNNYNRRKKK